MEKIKIIFFGNSEISLSALRPLIISDKFDVVAVVTGDDQKVGRSHSSRIENVVSKFSKENNLNLIKTENINKDIEKIKGKEVDYLITCSFGQYLSDEILSLPKLIPLNIHTSLLPKGRGGAPIHWAILEGEKETGVSFMEMVKEMDAGDYFSQIKVEITKNETYDSLYKKLSEIIENNIVNEVIKINENKITKTKQEENLVSKWFNVKKEDCFVNFNLSSNKIDQIIRGCFSKPTSWTTINNMNIKIGKSTLTNYNITVSKYIPGEIIDISNDGILVKTNDGTILIDEITIPGKKPNSVKQLINGKVPFKIGDNFSLKN